jgi:hypothetical protein
MLLLTVRSDGEGLLRRRLLALTYNKLKPGRPAARRETTGILLFCLPWLLTIARTDTQSEHLSDAATWLLDHMKWACSKPAATSQLQPPRRIYIQPCNIALY